MGEILIGTSGFSFDDWVGMVYPAGIRKQEMLPYYEKTFSFKALEVNCAYLFDAFRKDDEIIGKENIAGLCLCRQGLQK